MRDDPREVLDRGGVQDRVAPDVEDHRGGARIDRRRDGREVLPATIEDIGEDDRTVAEVLDRHLEHPAVVLSGTRGRAGRLAHLAGPLLRLAGSGDRPAGEPA